MTAQFSATAHGPRPALKAMFSCFFVGILFSSVFFQTMFLALLRYFGILYLDKFVDHFLGSLISGFIYAGTMVFVFLVTFVVSHAYFKGANPISRPMKYFLGGAVVMAISNSLAFVVTLVTRDKETMIFTTFLLGCILTIPVPWVLRSE